MQVVIIKGEGAVFGVNFGHPTVMGTLLHSCVRVTHCSQITLGGLVNPFKQLLLAALRH